MEDRKMLILGFVIVLFLIGYSGTGSEYKSFGEHWDDI